MNGVNDVYVIIDKNRLVVFRCEITLREIVYTGNDTGFFIQVCIKRKRLCFTFLLVDSDIDICEFS